MRSQEHREVGAFDGRHLAVEHFVRYTLLFRTPPHLSGREMRKTFRALLSPTEKGLLK
jgi:hypothetical protein